MIIIKNVINSGGACPYQLEAETSDGKWLYIRYRGGNLRYAVASDFYSWAHKKSDNVYDFSIKIGDDLDGYPDHDKFMEVLKDKIKLPEGFKFDVDI